MHNTTLREMLESLVDRHGLTAVLVALSNVCTDKAEHLLHNWQDPTSAKHWDRDAAKIAMAACDVKN